MASAGYAFVGEPEGGEEQDEEGKENMRQAMAFLGGEPPRKRHKPDQDEPAEPAHEEPLAEAA